MVVPLFAHVGGCIGVSVLVLNSEVVLLLAVLFSSEDVIPGCGWLTQPPAPCWLPIPVSIVPGLVMFIIVPGLSIPIWVPGRDVYAGGISLVIIVMGLLWLNVSCVVVVNTWNNECLYKARNVHTSQIFHSKSQGCKGLKLLVPVTW